MEYGARKRKTKREEFLEIVDEIIPWKERAAHIAPYDPSGEVVYGDSGYISGQKRPEIKENKHLAFLDSRIVRRPRSLPKVSKNGIDWERFIDHCKASIHCKVERIFWIVKRQFEYSKTAYRGLQKNANRLYALFLSSNFYMLACAGRSLKKPEIT